MKRLISSFVLFALFAVNAFAATIHTVEIRPLAQSALIGAGDFKSAEVTGSGEKAVLSVQLKEDAARRLRAYTAKNVGRELPFVVDGRIFRMPVIRVPIEGSAFQVEPLSRELADTIAQFINAHP